MTDHQSLIEQQHIPADDGWDDAAGEASERTIRGQLLKFADWRWTLGKEATPVANGTRLIALATAAMWVRWEDGKPVEHIVRRPGERLPEREKLSHANEEKWETGPGRGAQRPLGEYPNSSTSSIPTPPRHSPSRASRGGRAAVIELGDQIARMRGDVPRRRADHRIARRGDAYQVRPQVQAGAQGCRLEERQRQTHRNRQAGRADQADYHFGRCGVGRSGAAAVCAAAHVVRWARRRSRRRYRFLDRKRERVGCDDALPRAIRKKEQRPHHERCSCLGAGVRRPRSPYPSCQTRQDAAHPPWS